MDYDGTIRLGGSGLGGDDDWGVGGGFSGRSIWGSIRGGGRGSIRGGGRGSIRGRIGGCYARRAIIGGNGGRDVWDGDDDWDLYCLDTACRELSEIRWEMEKNGKNIPGIVLDPTTVVGGQVELVGQGD